MKGVPARTSHVWSVADQMVISGCNFFLAILLARSLGITGFGAFAVAQGYLFYSQAIMLPLVAWPLMSVVPAVASEIERRRLLSAFFGYAVLVAVTSAVLVSLGALIVGKAVVALSIEPLLVPLAIALMAYQLQDFLRRALIAVGENRAAFLADCFTYGGLFLTLFAVSVARDLNAKTALWAMAAFYIVPVPAIMWMLKVRPDITAAGNLLKKHARLSRDLFLSSQLQWIASSGVVLIGAGVVGQAAAGVIRVIQSALGPINVVLQWMENVIPVRSAQLYGNGGRGALGRFLVRCSGLGIMAALPALTVIAWLGNAFLGVLYGSEYVPFAPLLLLQAVYYLLGYQYRLASYFFRTIGESAALPVSAFVWAVVGCLAAVVLPAWIAEEGVMLALLAGEFAALVVLLLTLRYIRSNATDTTNYAVLRRKDGSPHLIIPATNWRTMVSGLQLYFPSRWTGKGYKALLKIGLYAAGKSHLVCSTTRPSDYYSGLDELIAAAQQYKASDVAVLVGAPGPRSKCTGRFMDDRGNPIAYGRVATDPAAVAALRAESAVLMLLNERGLGASVPTLLVERSLQRSPGYMLVETAGPDTVSGNILTNAHFDFLESLIDGRSAVWRDVVAELEAEVFGYPELKGHETVRRAIEFLKDAPIGEMKIVIEHGDFAPWNIRRRAHGGLFVFDWEYSKSNGVPWLDALHFAFQYSVLVDRCPSGEIISKLESVFDMSCADKYRETVADKIVRKDIYIALYLILSLLNEIGRAHV